MSNKTNEKEFKVGDKVRVKDDLVVGNKYGGITWFREMNEELKGKELTISRISSNFCFDDIVVKEAGFYLRKEMLEHIESYAKTRIEVALEIKDDVDELLDNLEIDTDNLTVEEVKDNVIEHLCPSQFGLNQYESCTCDDSDRCMDMEECRKCWNEVEYDIVSKSEFEEELETRQEISTDKEKYTPIRPVHYNSGQFDVIDFCHKNKVDFMTGNIIKYVVRAGKKDKSKELEDLEKAQEYLRRRIEYLKGDN